MKPLAVSPPPSPVGIDPRIHRRRIEVRRMEGRRRLRLLGAVLAALVLGAGGRLAVRSPLLDVDVVRVEGAVHTSVDAVRQAAGLRPGLPLFEVDEAEARAAVEALPWVAEAEVRREWPGTVSVRVTERTALAAAQDSEGSWWLVDRSGRVLDRAGERPGDLFSIEGVPSVPTPGSALAGADGALAVAAALSPRLAPLITALTVVEGGEIALKLNPQGTARLGPPSEVEAKLRALETVLAQLELDNLATVDVRLPASPVLTRL